MEWSAAKDVSQIVLLFVYFFRTNSTKSCMYMINVLHRKGIGDGRVCLTFPDGGLSQNPIISPKTKKIKTS
jgi:hypothetical protein